MLYKLLKPHLFADTIEKIPSVTKSQFLLEVGLAFGKGGGMFPFNY